MAAEAAQSMGVFALAATQQADGDVLGKPGAIYTIARGSSDAVANILSYEFMRELGVPVTSLPPSVFSIGAGVSLEEAAALVISQSGASICQCQPITGQHLSVPADQSRQTIKTERDGSTICTSIFYLML